jgi:hypothetical protein
MPASAPLLTGKNRRRALQALIAAPLLALGIAAGSGTAHAASSPTFVPEEIHLADGHCSISGWPNGEIFCGTSIGANFPNGTQEIFGIGLNDAVWTDWGTEARPSGWKSLGAPTTGRCNPSDGLALRNTGDYELTIFCLDNNAGTLWFDDRGAGVSAGWGGWNEDLG